VLLITLLTFLSIFSTISIKSKSSKIIVVPDDYPSIQEAINVANDGDIVHVKKGIYNESITINKKVRVEGEGNQTIIDVTGREVGIRITVGKVEVCNLTVRNAEWVGILLLRSRNCTIEGNLLTKNKVGISMSGCRFNRILSNVFLENNHGIKLLVGILGEHFYYSVKNLIKGNTFKKNKIGIEGNFASGNLIQENTIKDSINLIDSKGNIISNNKVESAKIILTGSSDGNLLANNTLEAGSYIYIHKSSENKVLNNSLNSSDIYCYQGKDNLIKGNIIINGTIDLSAYYSFSFGYNFEESTAYHNTIENNTILGAERGISLSDAVSNIVRNNTIRECKIGIYVIDESCMNTIEKNRIKNNENGIYIGGMGNKIIRNVLVENKLGIGVYYYPNFFYYNNFIDNEKQAEAVGKNKWDRNYWSDYESEDSDKDGIGDKPYVISEGNIDLHPLMKPYQYYEKLPKIKITMRGLNVTVSPSKIVTKLRTPVTISVNVTNIGAIPEKELAIEVYLETFWSAPIFQKRFELDPFTSKVFEIGIPTNEKGTHKILIVVGVKILGIIDPSFGPYELEEAKLIVKEGKQQHTEEPISETANLWILVLIVIVIIAIAVVLAFPTSQRRSEDEDSPSSRGIAQFSLGDAP